MHRLDLNAVFYSPILTCKPTWDNVCDYKDLSSGRIQQSFALQGPIQKKFWIFKSFFGLILSALSLMAFVLEFRMSRYTHTTEVGIDQSGKRHALSVSITLSKTLISVWHFPKQTQSRCPLRPHCTVKEFKKTF